MSARSSKGFTLVEVMVAMTIMSLVMLTTVTGLRTLGNTSATMERMTRRVDEMRSVSTFLRDALENSVVGSQSGGSDGLGFGGNNQDSGPSALFLVQEQSVIWRSKVLFGEAYGGSYFLRLAREGDNLMLQWQDPQGRRRPGDWRESPSRTVLENVEEFEISHRLGPQLPWVTGNVLRDPPSHIKLAVKADGRFWPDLIMKVQR